MKKFRQLAVRFVTQIRKGEEKYGLSPLDRMRLQWELKRAEDHPVVAPRRASPQRAQDDPRKFLMRVK